MKVRIPFFSGDDAVPYDHFGDRQVGGGGYLTELLRNAVGGAAMEPQNFRWIIEGRRGYGKSSFAEWARVYANNDALMCLVCLVKINEQSIGDSASGLFQAVLGHLPRTKQRNFRELVDAVRGVGPIAIDLSRPLSGEQFRKELKSLAEKLKGVVKSIVIIVDEVSHDPPVTEELSLELLKQFASVDAWEEDLPAIGLILLPLPSWDRIDLPENRKPWRHLSADPIHLAAFSPVETAGLLDKIFQDPWSCDTSFVDCLQRMSGGVPDVLQCIGYGACTIAQNEGRASLTERDVIASTSRHLAVAPRVRGYLDTNGLNLNAIKMNSAKSSALSALCTWPEDKGHFIHENRSDWIANGVEEGADLDQLEELLSQLENIDILEVVDSKIRFSAEVARMKIPKFVSER